MKRKLSRFLVAALLIALAAVPRRVESKVMVMAALDSSAVATSESQDATSIGDTGNVPAVVSGNESAGKPTVRFDKNGIQISGSGHGPRRQFGDKPIDVVAIMGVLFGCMIPMVIVAIVFYARHRRLKMHHETIRAMIEKGIPIPPEMAAGTRSDLVLGNTDPRPARGDFRSGLILVAVGAGLLMIAGKVGWILVFIGAARLVFWLVEDRKPSA
jgi:Domain of unknown function (DUF6249)